MVREGRKRSESVWRGSSIGHECRNMHPEPGVAHHRLTAATIATRPETCCQYRWWHRASQPENDMTIEKNEDKNTKQLHVTKHVTWVNTMTMNASAIQCSWVWNISVIVLTSLRRLGGIDLIVQSPEMKTTKVHSQHPTVRKPIQNPYSHDTQEMCFTRFSANQRHLGL